MLGKAGCYWNWCFGPSIAAKAPRALSDGPPALRLADVYAVIGRYLANPVPFDDYLQLCVEQADAVRREIETAKGPGVSKEELMARAGQEG